MAMASSVPWRKLSTELAFGGNEPIIVLTSKDSLSPTSETSYSLNQKLHPSNVLLTWQNGPPAGLRQQFSFSFLVFQGHSVGEIESNVWALVDGVALISFKANREIL